MERLEERGMRFVGKDETGKRMEIMELDKHPYFVGVQFHPEYLSRPHKPSPPYMGLLLAASGKLAAFMQLPADKRNAANIGYMSSPQHTDDDDEVEMQKLGGGDGFCPRNSTCGDSGFGGNLSGGKVPMDGSGDGL